jgi:hypothetical protein
MEVTTNIQATQGGSLDWGGSIGGWRMGTYFEDSVCILNMETPESTDICSTDVRERKKLRISGFCTEQLAVKNCHSWDSEDCICTRFGGKDWNIICFWHAKLRTCVRHPGAAVDQLNAPVRCSRERSRLEKEMQELSVYWRLWVCEPRKVKQSIDKSVDREEKSPVIRPRAFHH